MVQNPPEGTQRVIPYIVYDGAPAALEFICKAFGFEERFQSMHVEEYFSGFCPF